MTKKSVLATVLAMVLVIVWVIAGGFITQANVKLGSFKNTDDYLHKAYWVSFWAAFTTWTLVGIFVILLVIGMVMGVVLFGTGIGETEIAVAGAAKSVSNVEAAKLPPKTSKLAISSLLLGVLLSSVTGALAISTAIFMKKSPNYDSTVDALKTAYSDAIKASVMCVTGVALAGALLIAYVVYNNRAKKKAIAAEKKRIADQREYTKELVSIAASKKS